ncbi:hypothetical protein [Paraburkholderia ferrariae]|uniref:hypothetical protein n=1 Tax=Paraburkholderia ferrariae TaxID=386056 RepID=UPI000486C47B|nr:hypothetical protein [Paraburkholderia ferrariae]
MRERNNARVIRHGRTGGWVALALSLCASAHAQVIAPVAAAAIPVAAMQTVTVQHEDGVEIITSRTLKPGTPVPATAPAPDAAAGPASAGSPGNASSIQSRLSHQHAPMNATLSAGDPGMLADDVRGDHRLRANLLNADGTANEQADNSAHQLVNAQRAQAQADLKDALAGFDAARRSGASRIQLDQLQARIRTDLDEIHILTHAQQSGAQ